ncbi:hypothetical protein PCE1_000899 [Barthelona sp. PCE]
MFPRLNWTKPAANEATDAGLAEQFDTPIEMSRESFTQYVDFLRQGKVPAIEPLVQHLTTHKQNLRNLPNVIRFRCDRGKKKVVVVGDLHGRFFDLAQILDHYNIWDAERETDIPYMVFNGDFVDRGYYSLGVMVTLLYLRHLFPRRVFLNRGNHESRYSTLLYGFHSQLVRDYGEENVSIIYECFVDVFQCLPLISVIHDTVAVVHGGVPIKMVDGDLTTPASDENRIEYDDTECYSLTEINRVNRFQEPDGSLVMNNMMWADPLEQAAPTILPSSRGMSYQWPPQYTHSFLRVNHLRMLIRSHELVSEPKSMHNGRCVTVFTAARYVGDDNQGFVLEFTPQGLTRDPPRYTTRFFPRAAEIGGFKNDHNPFDALANNFDLLQSLLGENVDLKQKIDKSEN